MALTVTRELAPVFSALMVTMRAGSAMCTELGTMRVTEQVDALETMAVNPVQYLLVPRVLAGLLMVPLLAMLFDTAGLVGALLRRGGGQGHLGRAPSCAGPSSGWTPRTSAEGLIKGAVFGLTVTLIACYKGYNASRRRQGRGPGHHRGDGRRPRWPSSSSTTSSGVLLH